MPRRRRSCAVKPAAPPSSAAPRRPDRAGLPPRKNPAAPPDLAEMLRGTAFLALAPTAEGSLGRAVEAWLRWLSQSAAAWVRWLSQPALAWIRRAATALRLARQGPAALEALPVAPMEVVHGNEESTEASDAAIASAGSAASTNPNSSPDHTSEDGEGWTDVPHKKNKKNNPPQPLPLPSTSVSSSMNVMRQPTSKKMGNGRTQNEVICEARNRTATDPKPISNHSEVYDDEAFKYAVYCWKRHQLQSGSKKGEICDICFQESWGCERNILFKRDEMEKHCKTRHKFKLFLCEKKGCFVRCASLGEANLHKLYVHEKKPQDWWRRLLEELNFSEVNTKEA